MRFYVPTADYLESDRAAHNEAVYAESSDHHAPDWITLGYVSKQTPHGQGTYCGFPRWGVREATSDEVLQALGLDHPFGPGFRPNCQTAQDVSFHLAMSGAIGNWLNDNPGAHRPIHNVSRQELRDLRDRALAEHEAMMSHWDEITAKQAQEIRQALKEQGT